MKGIGSMRASFELRFLLPLVAVLVVVVSPAAGQLPDQERAGAAASGPVKYQISATITDYCPVEKIVILHALLFDFHNNSCQNPRRVSELKTPTLPNGPLYRDVRISGYHFADWKEGQPSPNTRNEVKVEISKTAATLTASGMLGKASCSKSATGNAAVEETVWRASIVPEVTLLEDEQRPQDLAAEIVPPQTTAVLKLSATCESDRPQSLQYTVTPILNGVAQASIYTGELQANKKANENGTDGASIHALWSSLPAKGESELSVTVANGKSVKEPANSPGS